MHACIHTYMHAYIHTCTPTYMHAYTYMQPHCSCADKGARAYKPTDIYTYTLIHTHFVAYIHAARQSQKGYIQGCLWWQGAHTHGASHYRAAETKHRQKQKQSKHSGKNARQRGWIPSASHQSSQASSVESLQCSAARFHHVIACACVCLSLSVWESIYTHIYTYVCVDR